MFSLMFHTSLPLSISELPLFRVIIMLQETLRNARVMASGLPSYLQYVMLCPHDIPQLLLYTIYCLIFADASFAIY